MKNRYVTEPQTKTREVNAIAHSFRWLHGLRVINEMGEMRIPRRRPFRSLIGDQVLLRASVATRNGLKTVEIPSVDLGTGEGLRPILQGDERDKIDASPVKALNRYLTLVDPRSMLSGVHANGIGGKPRLRSSSAIYSGGGGQPVHLQRRDSKAQASVSPYQRMAAGLIERRD